MSRREPAYTACRKFARWVIRHSCFDGCDLDGMDVQEKALELGLLIETNYDPAIHPENEEREPGDTYLEFAGELAIDKGIV